MKITTILLFLLVIAANSLSSAFARSPAVLDFVGIEPEGFGRNVPKGLIPAYNFEAGKDFAGRTPQSTQEANAKQMNVVETSETFTLSTLLVLLAVLALPFMTWFMIQSQVERKKLEAQIQSEEIIAKYRSIQSQKKSDDDQNNDHNSKAA